MSHLAPSENRCRRRAVVGQARIARITWIEVATQRLLPFCRILSRIGADISVVSGNDGHALMILFCVYDVFPPTFSIVVHMRHLQSMSYGTNSFVPPFCLSVLDDIIFIGIGGIYNLVARSAIGKARNGDDDGVCQGLQPAPAHEIALIGGVIDWVVSIVGIFTIVHNAPNVHAESNIVGVIKVGQAQSVAKFMTEHTNAIGARFQHFYGNYFPCLCSVV